MKKKSSKTLIIVESPAKAKTIQKYLGNGYSIAASVGHLIDLPKSRLAIDIEHDFQPEYITVRGKAKILKNLQAEAKKADTVLLASDNDREGEAISFHLKNALQQKNPGLPIKRIIFNEITPHAIREAVGDPMDINLDKINAQKARRLLDRIVGYHLSPILWKKVKNGLSAGRVQSVALKLICEREASVESFVPEEYWSLEAELQKGKSIFKAMLVEYQGRKPVIKNKTAVLEISGTLKDVAFKVTDVKITEKRLKPRAPFITSTLQQTAATRLGFTSRKTMRVAQQLYEGIDIGSGRIGLITYMRTDSTRVAAGALQEVRDFIHKSFPEELPGKPNFYSPGKGAQDAHEAIRPTYVDNTPESLKGYLTKEQYKLYAAIWERFVSSQMIMAIIKTVSVDFKVREALFRANSTSIKQKGYQRALHVLAQREKGKKLPRLTIGEEVTNLRFHPEQHFTSGPSRYTDASIVKILEEKGIGRPSTYEPIISVLLDRYYVVRKSRQLVATQLGRIINDLLVKSFPDVVDENFTAQMEQRLDEIEERKQEWVSLLKDFYGDFKKQVDYVMDTLESVKGVMDEETEYTCEKCGRPMVKKLGRFGFFLACTGFPECRSTKSVPLADCPRPGCNGKIISRRKQGGRGKEFYGCTNYPECDFITQFKPTNLKCPKCGYFLVDKEDNQRGAYKACINQECNYLHTREAEDQSA